MIQTQLASLVRSAMERAQSSGDLPAFPIPPFQMERPARKEHGDWSTSIALEVAKQAKMKPRDVADAIVKALGADPAEHIAGVEVAGPGFINIRLSHHWLTGLVRDVEQAGEAWGRSSATAPEKIQVEFVSANPTGPMHLGHGRWAAVGDTLARLLEASGNTVEREFYVNDFGVQMLKFGQSVAARYLELLGQKVEIPEGGYQGRYVIDIAKEILLEVGDKYRNVPDDERVAFMRVEGQRRMLLNQRLTLQRFGVEFDVWFSERSLHDEGAVERVVELLKQLGHLYEKDGALWLRTTDFGDDKDRVIVRSTDRMAAYLAADLAYFMDKLRRGFERLIYLVGADHHGWKREMQAAIRALGEDPEHCEFLIGQFVHLTRGGESVKMSKRTGEAVTFDELLDEVGVDAARYHFLRVSMDQSLNFDLEEVVRQSQENPVYYVQYAHARISSIVKHAREQGVTIAPLENVALEELQHESELDLLRKLGELPEAVEVGARRREPHRMTRYAEELASLFHSFYRDCRVVTDDEALTQARLHLVTAAQIGLRNTLGLLGVSAPESM
ncbi:MAG: arginine--tRNA ligase [Actinobacteria bacterium]|nr:MAG: arginine--tRNA ligase [Actinomycetota bacterium]